MSQNNEKISPVIFALKEIQSDATIPKNIKLKVERVISTLNSTYEMTIRINKAIDQFEEIIEDINLKPHTRTQIWNSISILESFIADEDRIS